MKLKNDTAAMIIVIYKVCTGWLHENCDYIWLHLVRGLESSGVVGKWANFPTLLYIFSLILNRSKANHKNSIIKGWKYRLTELFKEADA